jgi:DNA repair ATPase RecN
VAGKLKGIFIKLLLTSKIIYAIIKLPKEKENKKMMTYEEMRTNYKNLEKQKNELSAQMDQLRYEMSAIEMDKANAAFREVQRYIKQLYLFGYVLDVRVWNNDFGDYEWEENISVEDIRMRHKDAVIID